MDYSIPKEIRALYYVCLDHYKEIHSDHEVYCYLNDSVSDRLTGKEYATKIEAINIILKDLGL